MLTAYGKRPILNVTILSLMGVLALSAAQVLLVHTIKSSHGSVSAKSPGPNSRPALVDPQLNLRDWIARYDKIVSTVALTEAEHQKLSAALVSASAAPLARANRLETASLLRAISERYRAARAVAEALPTLSPAPTIKTDLCAYLDAAIRLLDDTYDSLDEISTTDAQGHRPVLVALMKRMGQLELLNRKHASAAERLRVRTASTIGVGLCK